MAHRSDDVDIVRSDGNPLVDEDSFEKNIFPVNNSGNESCGGDGRVGGGGNGSDLLAFDIGEDDADLPQCKIKRNYSCNLCPFFSQNPRSFLYHSRDVHFDRIKIFECSQCLYASKHSQKLQRHINMIHVAGKSRIKRTSKIAKIVKKDLRPIKPKPLEAEIREDLFEESPENKGGDSQALESILKDENEDLLEVDSEYKCSMCGFKNKNQKLVRRHEKIVHLKKRFLRCNKCSYVTHVKARYTKHVKYHTMPMIKCDLCDFRTPYKWNLDRHYKNHCGTGAFQCSKCNFRADIKQSLTVHEMNHHVPPVGQGAVMARKKNKVGASDVAATNLESGSAKGKFECSLANLAEGSKSETEMETECMKTKEEEEEDDDDDDDDVDDEGDHHVGDEEENEHREGDEEERKKKEDEKEKTTESGAFQNIRNVKVPYINKREAANNNHLQTDFIHPDDIVPRYGQIFVKNLKCKFCSYKAVFNHEIWRHEKRIHGYIRPESKKENIQKRPPPKLIPIQNKAGSATTASSSILKIPAVKNNLGRNSPGDVSPADKCVNENEFNEMCKKSCLTSSLKDFVSLIGDEEGLKTIPDSSRDDLDAESWNSEIAETDVKTMDSTGIEKQNHSHLFKVKNSSFFDKLKENLLTVKNEEQNLFCELCGHESKCLSESIAHEKRHSDFGFLNSLDGHHDNEIVVSGTELSSTRCQHCRQRCKTSADLFNHLKSCKAFEITCESQTNAEQVDSQRNASIIVEDHSGEEDEDKSEGNEMENRVFIWNDLGQRLEEEEEREAMALEIQSNEEYDLEIASICGTVSTKGSDNNESGTLVMEMDPCLNLTVKKVFKCPHCSFWASTASRFHVHIVGHLNKKPFECSLCLYRSNWRWDITKHIRLKSARDPSHLEAQVNMTDETGRRNYSKYNKYLTMMKVQEPSAESSGTGRRSKPGEATQGNVAERDIIPLPAPPRLTRAPTLCIPQKVPHGVPLRPPPPLKAAHQITSSFAPAAGKTSKEITKKTLWKCKKCNYRNSCKNNVLAHVKEHYDSQSESSTFLENKEDLLTKNESVNESEISTKPSVKTPSYKCGHCQQVSNWKHVIQRHCRLKHNGDAFIQVGWKEEQPVQLNHPTAKLENVEPSKNSADLISCDICPFTTDTEGDLTAHKLNHVDRPGSIFKCSYCPFYVPSKIAVLEHMEIHGAMEKFDATSLKVDNFDPRECNENFSAPNLEDCEESQKRYKCRQCPYLSNSRTQFLYHKQFHRPRDAPFKCMYCSYNVSRRHLLHQHLRVHHRQREKSRPIGHSGKRLAESSSANGLNATEIPLVWVLKSGNFQKMFKCRWCPHVNARKINIQEHEKMHINGERSPEVSEVSNQSLKFDCSECSYSFNDANALESHAKVHQDFHGENPCLVDSTRTEIVQVQELQNNAEMIEPEIVIREETDVLNFKNQEKIKLEKKSRSKEERCTNIEEDDNDELLSSQPENAYVQPINQTSDREGELENKEKTQKMLSFCNKCPARFFFKKELRIHSKFHMIHLPFRCSYCTYTARQRPHLLAHYRVHTEEYQQKTADLMSLYPVCSNSPCPETIISMKKSHVIEGRVWTVGPTGDTTNAEKENSKKEGVFPKPKPKHACHRCPARFFKSIALRYHLTLHGGSHPHKCKYCDYAVKTYGNLIKHQSVHEEQSKKASRSLKFSYEFPIFKRDLILNQKIDLNKNDESDKESWEKRSDSEIETLKLEFPKLMYSTYLKRGKVEEKKYKCQDCPSTFEKQDQYNIHLSLHGSKQKYQCEECSYSVQYYANYAHHLRKHHNHDEAVKMRCNKDEILGRSEEVDDKEEEDAKNDDDSGIGIIQMTCPGGQKTSCSEKKNRNGREGKKVYECRYCPYATIRRHALGNHVRRHYRVSAGRSAFECPYCDYSAPQSNFLRAHSKVHFGQPSRHKAEAYLKCDKMEIWCCEDEIDEDNRIGRKNVLVFQDRGQEAEVRFFPPICNLYDSSPEEKESKIFVNVDTWETIEERNNVTHENLLSFSYKARSRRTNDDQITDSRRDLLEMVEETCEDAEAESNRPKQESKTSERIKRWRGKNWRCKMCPHAFGKKNQYARHVALHGSNQRHTCNICDYSVKFYTNYVQHMRMHQRHEPNRVIHLKENRGVEKNKEKEKKIPSVGDGNNVQSPNEDCEDGEKKWSKTEAI